MDKDQVIRDVLTNLGKIAGQISRDLDQCRSQLFQNPSRDLITKRAALEAEIAVVHRSMQESQAAIRHLDEEKLKAEGLKEKERKLQMVEAIRRGERLPPCPQCGETKHVKLVDEVPPRGFKPDFLSDVNDHNWFVSMVCSRPECKLRFHFKPEVDGSKAVKATEKEEDEE